MSKQFHSLIAVREAISSGKTDCSRLVAYYLQQIEKHKDLNAFLEVYENEAREQALRIDEKLKTGSAGRLAGMVLALKDNICYEGHKVSASSKILEGFTSLYSSTVVQRLLAEDAIIIGRCNCDEFAMGASNENSGYGPVRNAADPTRVPGGSSGGSAVAVQADMCLAALGSDTGGSVRQPAAFCGLYGMYPTYGRVSRWGLLAYASSFDQISPITSSIEDMALLMGIVSVMDEHDATMLQEVPLTTDLTQAAKPMRIAYLNDCLNHEGLDSEIRQHTLDTIEKLKAAGHDVSGIDFPYLEYLVPCYYVLTTAEASSNLSRYSGLLFGHRSKVATDLESTFKKSRSEGFGAEVQRRIMLGTFVLSSDHYDAYYTKAQKVRQVIRQKTREIFKDYDIILTPTTSTPAFKLGEKASNPIAMYLADLFTVQAPLAGMPAISVPTGHHKGSNMPFGLQLMGNSGSDSMLIQFASQLARL